MGHTPPLCAEVYRLPLTGKTQLTCSVTDAYCASQDEDNLREALRYSAAMLGELRTSSLTPQKYFELYMQVFDELRHLEVGTPAVCSWHWQVSPMANPDMLDAFLRAGSDTYQHDRPTPACNVGFTAAALLPHC